MNSDNGKVIQTPCKPIQGIKISDKGMIIINCLKREMINDNEPLPNDSKAPAIKIPNVERTKLNDKIRSPTIPISNID